jgi:hypothetical protein
MQWGNFDLAALRDRDIGTERRTLREPRLQFRVERSPSHRLEDRVAIVNRHDKPPMESIWISKARIAHEIERRVETLSAEVDCLRRSREKVFRTPPVEWIKDRLGNLQEVLEQRTARSAQVLRKLLGPIRMEIVSPDIGRPFHRAVTTLDALALTETPPAGAEGGSNSLQRWRRWELNPRPRSRKKWRLRVCPAL